MTQAYNLAILANAVDSSGKLNVATNSTGVLPLANGGTGTTNTVNTVVAGTGISIATAGTQVTVTNTSSASGTVTSVATGNGLQGGTITTSGTLSVACPSANTVGSYASVMMNIENSSIPALGSDYSAGGGNNQFGAAYIPFNSEQGITGWRINVQLSGSWKWMGASNGGQNPASYKAFGLACRVS